MADITEKMDKERLIRLSRSSISEVPETIVDPGPILLKRIITDDAGTTVKTLRGGHVSLTFTNGNKYEGTILNGMIEGNGKFVWSDETVYEGEFKNGCISGKGEYKWPDGSQYVGEVSEGYRHGNGIFYHASGQYVYEGQWNRGIKEGKGKMTFRGIESSYYEGEWSNNLQNGYGTRYYESGNFYEGEWKDSRRHGNGTMHWLTRQEKYCGQWKEGVQNGQGEHIWYVEQMDNSQYPLCNRYHGDWVDGLRHGHGTFYYASGARFEGSWNKNKKHGEGQYTLPNGHCIEGQFKDDKLVNPEHIEHIKGTIEESITPGQRPKTPLGSMIGDIDGSRGGGTTRQFNVGVASLIPSTDDTVSELQKVHRVILRYLTQLKRTYHFYSSLLKSELSTDPDCNNMLKRLQLWQIFADCNLHLYNLTMNEVNTLMQRATGSSSNDANNLSSPFLMREYLQCVVHVAHTAMCKDCDNGETPSLDKCLDQFIRLAFLPNVCQLKGLVFKYLPQTSPHLKQVTSLYGKFSHPQSSPTLRDFIAFLKDNGVIGTKDSIITVQDVMAILTKLHPLAINEGHYNLNNPMSFLEFFNSLIACSLKWYDSKTTSTINNGVESPAVKQEVDHHDSVEEDESAVTTEKGDSEIIDGRESEDRDKAGSDGVVSHHHVMFEDQLLYHQNSDGQEMCREDSNQTDELNLFGDVTISADKVAQGLEQFLVMFETV